MSENKKPIKKQIIPAHQDLNKAILVEEEKVEEANEEEGAESSFNFNSFKEQIEQEVHPLESLPAKEEVEQIPQAEMILLDRKRGEMGSYGDLSLEKSLASHKKSLSDSKVKAFQDDEEEEQKAEVTQVKMKTKTPKNVQKINFS